MDTVIPMMTTAGQDSNVVVVVVVGGGAGKPGKTDGRAMLTTVNGVCVCVWVGGG